MLSVLRSTAALRASAVPLLAALTLSLPPGVADATVFVPMSDGELADRAPLILEARVLAVEPAPGARPATDYLVEVERLIKGSLPAGALVVRVPGGVRADGVGLHLWGAPRLQEGGEVLLFVESRGDGTFGLHQFLLGAFYITGEEPSRVAWRDLSAARRITPPGAALPADGPRDLEKFRSWLVDRVHGRVRIADYFRSSSADPVSLPGKYQTLVTTDDPPPLGCGENGGHSVRWFNFDAAATDAAAADASVGWRTHFSGQEGLADGGVEAFSAALEAWAGDPNTPIRYVWDGLTAATGGFSVADGTNAVLFGDPNDEIGGSFDGSGVLALGGVWFDCSLSVYREESFHPAFEGDVVTQNGLEHFFTSAGAAVSGDPAKAAEQLFGHELGHTLGLAHSQNEQALMFADFHQDRRGAALDTDDLAGVLYLYGPRDLEPPAAPSGLVASSTGAGGVRLEWNDNSDDESVFRLERRAAKDFELMTTIAADATTFIDTGAKPATLYSYRLRAQNGAGASAYSAEVEVLTSEDLRPAAPSNLRAAPLSSSEIRLAWQDNSDAESGFMVEIRVASTWLEIPAQLPPDTRKIIVEGLTPATSFELRVRAVNGFGASDPSNRAVVNTFENDEACVVSGDELCLLGGRFKVSVSFRNQYAGGEEGTATVVPATDGSGLFWFFGSENIELIVKALDGRHLNQHFWIFYGALSDLEYWITVTDTETGAIEIYHNPPGEICGVADTVAFPGELPGPGVGARAARSIRAAFGARQSLDVSALTLAPVVEDVSAPALESGSCAPGPENLCLLSDRLSVEVQWRNPFDGSEGAGQAVFDTDGSGFFWFFDIENTELVIKALDGSSLNQHIWIFYGALTDLEYWITVTDTLTGENRMYHNPPGEVCGRADTEAFAVTPAGDP